MAIVPETHAENAERAAARVARRPHSEDARWRAAPRYAIAKYIEDASGDTVTVEEGSLYPALYRMERRG
jgi:hypothetical protein